MFKFGIPKKAIKEVAVEKYPDTPVLTMLPKPAKKGSAYKFSLNKKALEVLSIDLETPNYVSFSFEEEVPMFAITTGNPVAQSKVTKKGEFSDSKCHQYITKKFNHTSGDFKLVKYTEDSGVIIYKLELVKEEDTSVETFQVIEKSDEVVLEEKVFA